MPEYSASQFYEDLVKHRLIIPVGINGIFGRGAVFEKVLHAFDDLVSRTAKDDGAERVMFPPCLSRKLIEKSEYLNSFPHLAGAVFSFQGNDKKHAELRTHLHDGKPWAEFLEMTDVVLAPAACYPVYPTCTGTLPPQGRLVDIENWIFRHEPSLEPTRMQSFRLREFVRAGSPDVVVAWRDMWLARGLTMMKALGLPAQDDVAADPFFGRGGRMLAIDQKEHRLKFEIMVPVISETNPTAVCSFNWHQDHFGRLFEIKTPDGETAQTACLGFGLERVTMALFKTHGFDPEEWPQPVRSMLWPQ